MATEFELQVLSELSEIKSTASATAATVEGLDTRLFHVQSGVITVLQGDIAEIKQDQEDDKKWERIHNVLHYSIGPLLVFLHGLARKLGFSI